MSQKLPSKTFTIGLVLIFILVVIIYFVILNIGRQDIIIEKQVNLEPNRQLVETNDLEEKLPLKEDIARFLFVYFNQRFDTGDQKLDFVKHEYRRFSFISVESDLQKRWKQTLVSNLRKLIDTIETGEFATDEPDSELRSLMHEVEK